MRCPKCGNEVNLGESFCGQCGTPTTLPALPHRVVVAQSGYVPIIPPANDMSIAQPQTPDLHLLTQARDFPTHPTPSVGQEYKSSVSQQTGFYHNATASLPFSSPEHYNAHTSSAHRPSIARGQPRSSAGFPGVNQIDPASQQRSPTGAYNVPPTHYNNAAFAGRHGQKNGYRPEVATTVRRQTHQATILTICICLIVALISIVGLLSYLLLKTPAKQTPSAAANMVTRPTQSIQTKGNAATLPSGTQVYSNMTPTSLADTNFVWCGSSCANNNFAVEYPANWIPGTVGSGQGVSFINPGQSDETALFKVVEPGNSGTTADQMLTNDLQINYVGKPGYIAPTTEHVATFGGHVWSTAIAYYQGGTQRERIEVYATIYQQKAYIIDLQAPDAQFDGANTDYYLAMLNRYHFLY